MLIQFSVENYLSIGPEQVFSLLATPDTRHAAHLISDTPRKGESLLRAAAIYGANGSGKSNLVNAMKFAQRFIINGTRGSQAIPTKPFKLGTDTSAPSKFEFIFKTQGIIYNYGFRLDSSRILEEWLFATPKTQEVLFFQRTTSKDGKVEVEFGPSFTERTAKGKQFLAFVAEGTRPNQLFLTEAMERNVPTIRPAIDWFEHVLEVISAESQFDSLETAMGGSEAYADYLQACLRDANTGIDRIIMEEVPFDFDNLMPGLSGSDKELVLQKIATLKSHEELVVSGPNGSRFTLNKGKDGLPICTRLKTQHSAADGRFVTFDIDEESDGTQRLIHLLPVLSILKTKHEKVFVIDELDRRFHTLLTRFFVQTALDCDEAHRQSQLIFTTHDTNLLDLDLLRRDEIWFMEKDQGGASNLYSLAEFKIRTDLKIEKGYLAGRFGAIPFATDTASLGWKEQSSSLNETQRGEMAGSAA